MTVSSQLKLKLHVSRKWRIKIFKIYVSYIVVRSDIEAPSCSLFKFDELLLVINLKILAMYQEITSKII